MGHSTSSGIVSAALALLEKVGGAGAVAEVEELVSQDVFDNNCSGKKICIIAFLKDILDEYVQGCRCVRVRVRVVMVAIRASRGRVSSMAACCK